MGVNVKHNPLRISHSTVLGLDLAQTQDGIFEHHLRALRLYVETLDYPASHLLIL